MSATRASCLTRPVSSLRVSPDPFKTPTNEMYNQAYEVVRGMYDQVRLAPVLPDGPDADPRVARACHSASPRSSTPR